MPFAPLTPAQIDFTPEGVPCSLLYGDSYHPAAGAFQQARHVFLDGNALPGRWQGRERFVVLETGFGLGNNFLACWNAWRQDPQRCRQLHFVSIERHPLRRDDLHAVHRASALPELAEQLVDSWPPLTPNLHRLSFEGGRVQLLLALGDVAEWLPELDLRVDAFFLDGFAPAKNAQMWEPRLYKAMARLAAPGATAATWSAARSVRDGLTSAGFEVTAAPGVGGKYHITQARYAPRFVPRRTLGRPVGEPASASRHAVVIGAGLAGCATAWALADQGWRSTVIDRRAQPAMETSGNPAGLFHGIVNAHDGTHARFNRAASFEAQHAIRQAIATHGVPGEVNGLLRLEASAQTVAQMQALLDRLGLPSDYVQALSAAEASRRSDASLDVPAWFFPGGGWVEPGGLARSLLARAGEAVQLRADTAVASLARHGSGWRLLDAQGHVLTEADVVVLANAHDALRLAPPGHGWLTERIRGQISTLPASAVAGGLPRVPIAGGGYLLPSAQGLAVFGATSHSGDDDPALRGAVHQHNLNVLARLTGRAQDVIPIDALDGRIGWRWSTDDRLPLIGAVPDAAALGQARRRPDQARFVPRVPGLYVLGALGSRGITWCALGAQVLASQISGAPSPVEVTLLDAVDPGRFISRAVRRASLPE